MFKTTYSSRYRKFLAALRKAREDRDITQVQLAGRLKVPQSLISKIERGQRRMDIVELEMWCDAMQIDMHDFLKSI
jgi:transcriptional regulator with XRE-family HTH domain